MTLELVIENNISHTISKLAIRGKCYERLHLIMLFSKNLTVKLIMIAHLAAISGTSRSEEPNECNPNASLLTSLLSLVDNRVQSRNNADCLNRVTLSDHHYFVSEQDDTAYRTKISLRNQGGIVSQDSFGEKPFIQTSSAAPKENEKPVIQTEFRLER